MSMSTFNSSSESNSSVSSSSSSLSPVSLPPNERHTNSILPHLPSSSFSHLNSHHRFDSSLLYLPTENDFTSDADSHYDEISLLNSSWGTQIPQQTAQKRWRNHHYQREREREKENEKEEKPENDDGNNDDPNDSEHPHPHPHVTSESQSLHYSTADPSSCASPEIPNETFPRHKRVKITLPNHFPTDDHEMPASSSFCPHDLSSHLQRHYVNSSDTNMESDDDNGNVISMANTAVIPFPLPDFPISVRSHGHYHQIENENECGDDNDHDPTELKRKERKNPMVIINCNDDDKNSEDSVHHDDFKSENEYIHTSSQTDEKGNDHNEEDEENDDNDGSDDDDDGGNDDDDMDTYSTDSDDFPTHKAYREYGSFSILNYPNAPQNTQNDTISDNGTLSESQVENSIHFDSYDSLYSTYQSALLTTSPLSPPLIDLIIDYLSAEYVEECYEQMMSHMIQLGDTIRHCVLDMNRLHIEIPHPPISDSSFSTMQSKVQQWFFTLWKGRASPSQYSNCFEAFFKPIHRIHTDQLHRNVHKEVMGSVYQYVSENCVKGIYHFIGKLEERLGTRQMDRWYKEAREMKGQAEDSVDNNPHQEESEENEDHGNDKDDEDGDGDDDLYYLSSSTLRYLITQSFSPQHFQSLSDIIQQEIEEWQHQHDIIDTYLDLWEHKLLFAQNFLSHACDVLNAPSGGMECGWIPFANRKTIYPEIQMKGKVMFGMRKKGKEGEGGVGQRDQIENEEKRTLIDSFSLRGSGLLPTSAAPPSFVSSASPSTSPSPSISPFSLPVLAPISSPSTPSLSNPFTIRLPLHPTSSSSSSPLNTLINNIVKQCQIPIPIPMVSIAPIYVDDMGPSQQYLSNLLCKYLNHLNDILRIQRTVSLTMENQSESKAKGSDSLTLFPPNMNDMDILVESCRYLLSMYYHHFMYRDGERDEIMREYNDLECLTLEMNEGNDIVMDKKRFRELVGGIVNSDNNHYHVTEEALLALQKSAEAYLVEIFNRIGQVKMMDNNNAIMGNHLKTFGKGVEMMGIDRNQ